MDQSSEQNGEHPTSRLIHNGKYFLFVDMGLRILPGHWMFVQSDTEKGGKGPSFIAGIFSTSLLLSDLKPYHTAIFYSVMFNILKVIPKQLGSTARKGRRKVKTVLRQYHPFTPFY